MMTIEASPHQSRLRLSGKTEWDYLSSVGTVYDPDILLLLRAIALHFWISFEFDSIAPVLWLAPSYHFWVNFAPDSDLLFPSSSALSRDFSL